VGALELAERLLELATELGGDGQVIEALRLIAALSERDARQPMGLVELAVETERTLEFRQCRVALARCHERLPELEVGPPVRRRTREVASEGLACLCRLLERHVDRTKRAIDPIPEPAEGPRTLERRTCGL